MIDLPAPVQQSILGGFHRPVPYSVYQKIQNPFKFKSGITYCSSLTALNASNNDPQLIYASAHIEN